jgi:hypothetical protein
MPGVGPPPGWRQYQTDLCESKIDVRRTGFE